MTDTVGIDLGTTYSLVAEFGDAGFRVFPADTGDRSTPSVVLIEPDRCVVGAEAKRSAPVYPDQTFSFFKRDMGSDDAERTVAGRKWSPSALSAQILDSLRSDVERETGTRPERAVITVPAYFGERARRATVEAGQLANLEVLELIHEPTAAALAFGFGRRDEPDQTVLVYDLGGGTFDVSLVQTEHGNLSVIATDGDHELGGKDWDDVLIGIVAEQFSAQHGLDPRMDQAATADLRERCEEAKRTLSRRPEATLNVIFDGNADRIRVTAEEFEAASSSLLAATESLLIKVIKDAGLAWTDVQATLLVGGSTRMPACAKLVERVTGRAPIRGVDPDIAVVQGAALLAARHTAETQPSFSTRTGLSRLPIVKDVTAHALGFVVINETGDRYLNEVMITRNAPIPAEITKLKRIDRGATELDVYVLQGHQERPLATEPLGRYRFRNLPNADADRDIHISFMYDEDGIVQVSGLIGGKELPSPEHDAHDKDLSWTDEDPRDHARTALAVVLLIDCSASMTGHKMTEAKDSCIEFASILGALSGTRVGLVSFATGSRIESPLTENTELITDSARRLDIYGSTDLTSGLSHAASLLDADTGRRVIVVVTDGAPDDADTARAGARQCSEQEIEIVTVGVSGADSAFLASIATTDRDSMFTDDLRGALRSVARSLAGGLVRKA